MWALLWGEGGMVLLWRTYGDCCCSGYCCVWWTCGLFLGYELRWVTSVHANLQWLNMLKMSLRLMLDLSLSLSSGFFAALFFSLCVCVWTCMYMHACVYVCMCMHTCVSMSSWWSIFCVIWNTWQSHICRNHCVVCFFAYRFHQRVQFSSSFQNRKKHFSKDDPQKQADAVLNEGWKYEGRVQLS